MAKHQSQTRSQCAKQCISQLEAPRIPNLSIPVHTAIEKFGKVPVYKSKAMAQIEPKLP